MSAALNGNVKEVLRLLDKGVNKDYKDSVHILLLSLLIKNYPPPPLPPLFII